MAISNFIQGQRQSLGNTLDALTYIPKAFGLPEMGISERIAGNSTWLTDPNNNPIPKGQAYEPVTAPVDNRNPFLEQGLLDPLNINTTSNNNSSGSTQQTKQPTTTNNFDPMNRNIDPGPGYFWDAADGWKPVGGGSSYDAERARREQEARDNINSGFGQHVNNLNNLIPHYRLARLTLSAVKSCYNKRSQLLRVCQRVSCEFEQVKTD